MKYRMMFEDAQVQRARRYGAGPGLPTKRTTLVFGFEQRKRCRWNRNFLQYRRAGVAVTGSIVRRRLRDSDPSSGRRHGTAVRYALRERRPRAGSRTRDVYGAIFRIRDLARPALHRQAEPRSPQMNDQSRPMCSNIQAMSTGASATVPDKTSCSVRRRVSPPR